ncbi:MAG: hypothetical protein ACJ79M_02600 [Myxococcales bacterium]
MKSHTRYLEMNVPARLAFVNITGEVERADTNSYRYRIVVEQSRCLPRGKSG